MNKRTDNYWAQRSVKRLAKAEKASIPYLKQVQKTYNDSAKATVESVKAMYRAYYRNDKTFNMAALNMIAPQGDIKRLKDEMKRLGLSTSLPKQYRGRMTRLELLNAQMWAEAKKAYLKENVYSTDLYDKIFRESYYQTGFDMAKGLGENLAFSNLDKTTVEKVLETKFEGKDFSQRIWSNTDHLAESLKDIMAKAIATGQPLERTSMEVRERFAVGTSNANRLIRTETCYFENNAELAAYAEMGIEEFVFMATLDSRTSDVCQNMDGKRFKMSKAQIGENVPPLHPNCRSTIRAYLGEEFEPTTRIARDPQTGKNYDIKNMTYEQWKKQIEQKIPADKVSELPKSHYRKVFGSAYNKQWVLNNKALSGSEKQALNPIMNRYKEVYRIPEVSYPEDIKTADVYADGITIEIKKFSSINSLQQQMRKASHQINKNGILLLDSSKTELDKDVIISEVKQKQNRYNIDHVIISDGEKIVAEIKRSSATANQRGSRL